MKRKFIYAVTGISCALCATTFALALQLPYPKITDVGQHATQAVHIREKISSTRLKKLYRSARNSIHVKRTITASKHNTRKTTHTARKSVKKVSGQAINHHPITQTARNSLRVHHVIHQGIIEMARNAIRTPALQTGQNNRAWQAFMKRTLTGKTTAKQTIASKKTNSMLSTETAASPNTLQTSSSAPPLSEPSHRASRNPQAKGSISGGQLISLNFNNIRTRELLQIIAQFVGINFVISDSVKGEMSIHLTRVPWHEALRVILNAQGLAERRLGGIIMIAPIREMATYDVEQLRAREQIQNLEPLHNLVLRLKYANAETVSKMLTKESSKPMLSARGSVTVDQRTNSIWLRDTPAKLAMLRRVIHRIDVPAKQVVVEARIVEIQRNFESEFGVRLGLTAGTELTGTLNGANQLQQGISPANIDPLRDRLNFDLPAKPLFGRAGSIAVGLTRIGDAYLDLELSALEQEGKVHLVSSPSLLTSNLHPAFIQTGEEIPYQEATSSGATAIQFKDATLSLRVTPQVTPDNRVVLHLEVTNNRAAPAIQLEGGGTAIPIITQEEQSRVLVNDGQTIVLGGIYTKVKSKIMTRVPFFGTLPLVGHLFRNTRNVNKNLELLIFLTPKIIHSPNELD